MAYSLLLSATYLEVSRELSHKSRQLCFESAFWPEYAAYDPQAFVAEELQSLQYKHK